MPITKRVPQKLTVFEQAAVDALAGPVVDKMRTRIAKGLDGDGFAFPAYGSLYRRQLEAVGDSGRVDLSRSGGLVRCLKMKRSKILKGQAVMVFGGGPGLSQRSYLPPPWVFSAKKSPEQQARALQRWMATPKKVRKNFKSSVLLRWMMFGAGHSYRRHPLGISPADKPELLRLLERAPIFGTDTGTTR